MNTQMRNILSQIKKLSVSEILQKKDNNGVSYVKYVFQIYYILFGQVCNVCPNKIPTYINQIKNYIMEEDKTNKNSRYKLKKGKVIHVFGTNQYYSEHNITDNIAIKLLSKNPNRISLFAKFPENWRTETKGTETKGTETKGTETKTSKLKEVKK